MKVRKRELEYSSRKRAFVGRRTALDEKKKKKLMMRAPLARVPQWVVHDVVFTAKLG
jgi:hypothetical protein